MKVHIQRKHYYCLSSSEANQDFPVFKFVFLIGKVSAVNYEKGKVFSSKDKKQQIYS